MEERRMKNLKEMNNNNSIKSIKSYTNFTGLKALRTLLFVLILTFAFSTPALAAQKYRIYDWSTGKVCYNSRGRLVKNKWVKSKNKKYYFNKKGYATVGLKKINGKKYYFNKNGVMKTGFVTINDDRYFFNKKGVMQKGFVTYKNKTYYLNKKGKMQKGLKNIEGEKYYFNKKGVMEKGFVTIDGEEYYFDSDGTMHKGFVTVNRETFHFDNDGVMSVGFEDIEGAKYYFESTGVMNRGWLKKKGNKYYSNVNSGKFVIGLGRIDSTYYYFDNNGALETSEGRYQYNNAYYYVNKSGKIKFSSWVYNADGTRWFFGSDGKQLMNGWYTIADRKYHFDANGNVETCKWIDGIYLMADGCALPETETKLEAAEEGLITKEMLDELDLEGTNKLMIVAHPDDETIFGGGHISQGGYFIVCLTNGYNLNRVLEFQAILQATGNKGIILKYPDQIGGVRSDWSECNGQILCDINLLLTYKDWEMIVTHSPMGEYGHIHHKLTSRLVTYSHLMNNLSDNLYYFGRYYKTADLAEQAGVPKMTNEMITAKMGLYNIYQSQARAVDNHRHMTEYEDWRLEKNWRY